MFLTNFENPFLEESFLGAAMMTAVAASGTATASVAATNASMNTDSSLLGSTKSISSNTWKATTSEESIQNMAIAAATAGAAFGASSYLNGASSTAGAGSSATTSAGSNVGAASNTATAANTTVYVNPGLSNATVLTSNTANSSSFLTNLGNATVKIGTATGSNILATSAIKGQSINEVIAAQGGVDRVILNSALQIVGEAGAMQIGNAAHTGQITGGQQIALPAALGCGIGAGMSGGGSGCASGAAAGVVGELTADSLYQGGTGTFGNTNQARQIAVVAGGISGAASSLFTSIALGDEDDKTAKNVYAGNFLGTNAAANNAVFKERPLQSDKPKLSKILSKIDLDILDEKNIKLVHEQLFFEDAKGGNLGYFNDNQVREDASSLLSSYKTTMIGFDDKIMREAVNNVGNKTIPYSLLGFDSCVGKFNCQDWSQLVRTEYNRLQTEKNLDTWNNIINSNWR